MEMFLGFMVLLACLFLGIKHGGIGLAVISGIGLMAYTFLFGYKPGSPPIGVMLTIMAVVTCAGFLQTSGGLTVMLKYAERFLRNNPKHITILAPVTTWLLTVLCGTGHVVYTMFPIIYDISIKENIRPERPMAVSSIASQMGISASPVSVAVVSIVGFMAAAGYTYSLLQILAVSIPATLIGVIAAALMSYRRGKDLADDKEFQEMIKDPEQKKYVYGENESLQGKELPSSYYHATIIFLVGILCIAVLGNFPDLLPHFADAKGKMQAISMTTVIQMVMLFVSSIILFVCHTKAKEVGNSQVFRAGIVALVSVYGVAWMADTYFANHMAVLIYDIPCGQYFREDEGADSHVFKKGFVFFVQVFRIVDTGYCFLRSQCMGQHATGDIFHFVGHDGDEQFGMCGSGFFQAADRSRFYIEGHEVYVVGDF